MLDYTDSRNLSPNSYDVFYPDSMIDEMSSVTQQSLLQNCLDLIIPMYLDPQLKKESMNLIEHTIESINLYGVAEPDICGLIPRCGSVMTLGENSILQDMIIIVLFLEIDQLIL